MGTLMVNKSILNRNFVTNQGGVAFINSGLLVMDSTSVFSNVADMDGGALIGVKEWKAHFI